MLERSLRAAPRPTPAAWLLAGVLTLAACGTVDNPEFQPVVPRELAVDDAVSAVRQAVDRLLAPRPEPEAEVRAALRREAEVIEALLLGSDELAERRDLVQPLRLRVLQFAAEYPQDAERHAVRIREAMALLTPPPPAETRP